MSDRGVLAVDIEGTGQCFVKHPIVEVGISVKRLDTGRTMTTSCHTGRAHSEEYEPRCVREFWSQVDPSGERRLAYTSAQPQWDLWLGVETEFVQTFRQHGSVSVVSDNPAYDIGGISFNLQRYLNVPDVHYISGTYHAVRDSHSTLEALSAMRGELRREFETKLLDWFHDAFPASERAEHDHNAAHDASYIANTWIAAHHYAKACAAGKAPF